MKALPCVREGFMLQDMRIMIKVYFITILLLILSHVSIKGQTLEHEVKVPKNYHLDQVVNVDNKGYLLVFSKPRKAEKGMVILQFFNTNNELKWEKTISKKSIDKKRKPKVN